MRYAALFIWVLLLPTHGLFAQPIEEAKPTNMQIFQALALECLNFMPEAKDPAYLIDMPAQMPYLRSALSANLQEAGIATYLADSTYINQPASLSTLKYDVDEARVSYERLKKKKAKRIIQLTVATSLVTANGQLLSDAACEKQFEDVVSVSDLEDLASTSYPETQAAPIKASFGRRVLQPVMLAAGTALSVFLFFTLRSDSDEE